MENFIFFPSACPENVGGKFAGTDVWISKYDETTLDWGKPQNEKTFNNKGTNAVVGINEKGDGSISVKYYGNQKGLRVSTHSS